MRSWRHSTTIAILEKLRLWNRGRRRSGADDVDHRGVMNAGGGQDEAVADGILEGKPLPEMEPHADGVEHATKHEQERNPLRHGRHQRMPGNDHRPAL